MGTLYIVATPIGNLKDITLRAIEVLQSVQFIACEDTRRTGMLLKNLRLRDYPKQNEQPVLISYYEQNELQRISQIMTILHNEQDVVLVSDSGTPTISDPGFKLVREAIAQGIPVQSIPGPSSVISALVSSGLPTDKFLFAGYLPKKQGNQRKLLENIKSVIQIAQLTVILFETPHRLVKTLALMQDIFGDIELTVCRELTKVHEEVIKEKINMLRTRYENSSPKGEFVILFNIAR